jgi:hypothetical protein
MVVYVHKFTIPKQDLEKLKKGDSFTGDYSAGVFYSNGNVATLAGKPAVTVTVTMIDPDTNDARLSTLGMKLTFRNDKTIWTTDCVKAGTSTSNSAVASHVGDNGNGSIVGSQVATDFGSVTDKMTGSQYLSVTSTLTTPAALLASYAVKLAKFTGRSNYGIVNCTQFNGGGRDQTFRYGPQTQMVIPMYFGAGSVVSASGLEQTGTTTRSSIASQIITATGSGGSRVGSGKVVYKFPPATGVSPNTNN